MALDGAMSSMTSSMDSDQWNSDAEKPYGSQMGESLTVGDGFDAATLAAATIVAEQVISKRDAAERAARASAANEAKAARRRAASFLRALLPRAGFGHAGVTLQVSS